MIVYLAGFKTIEKHWTKPTNDIYLLSSFWEHKSGKYGDYVKQKKHILDSGAYSALTGTAKKIDWNDYIEKYANFINKHNINLFFELDIDSIVGLKEVERLRNKLEKLTNKQCIPVWHKSRGKEYWLKMISDYKYCAIGGIVTKEIKPSEYPFFNWFLSEAKKQNCKVHGLGFTKTSILPNYKFYSVDSTTWNVGGKFGNLVVLNNNNFPIQRYKKEGFKVKDTNKINIYNFEQWLKFQKYAETNL